MFYKSESGYTTTKATEVLKGQNEAMLLGSTPETVFEWVDHKPTKNIIGYKYWFVTDGVNGAYEVKFESEQKGFNQYDKVEFDNITAFQRYTKVYFQAEAIKKAK